MRVETLGFNHGGAGDRVARSRCGSIQSGPIGRRSTRGRREEPDGAIGEDAVYVKKDNLDLLRALLGHAAIVMNSSCGRTFHRRDAEAPRNQRFNTNETCSCAVDAMRQELLNSSMEIYCPNLGLATLVFFVPSWFKFS